MGTASASPRSTVQIQSFPSLCFRSGKRIKKTRKYDIITTPAERVEMAPLNEEDDEDEDSTVFDVKYRYCCIHPLRLAH